MSTSYLKYVCLNSLAITLSKSYNSGQDSWFKTNNICSVAAFDIIVLEA